MPGTTGWKPCAAAKAAPQLRGLDAAIEEAGFSGPRKAERGGEVMGRSELLAKKR
jgi:serine/threonine-protein kinase HipA|tara:strand:- start:966 stop:1130 length:165 start_codon:yes stop_codon:yes gene_type:complete